MYKLNFENLHSKPEERKKIICLGLQPFYKPMEQQGWVYKLTDSENLNNNPAIAKMLFHHNKEVGLYFLKKFSYGRKLFPNDPVDIVAKNIKHNIEKNINYSVIENDQQYKNKLKKLKYFLKKKKYTISLIREDFSLENHSNNDHNE